MAELCRLGRWFRDASVLGPLAAGATWSPTAAAGGAELDTDEVAEVEFFTVRAPVTAARAVELLEHIWPVLDDKPVRTYINICGRHDALMQPVIENVYLRPYEKPVVFGTNIVDALNAVKSGGQPALLNTTLKYKRRLTIEARAGAAPITEDFEICAWGYRYYIEELPKILPFQQFPVDLLVQDKPRGKTLSFNKAAIPITKDYWDRLPGGAMQDKPVIMPYMRWFRNANATTLNLEYIFRRDQLLVESDEMNAYWEFDAHPESALLLTHLGMRGADHLQWVWLAMTADQYHVQHPKGRIRVDSTINPKLNFGAVQPELPDGLPLYHPIPAFPGGGALIYREKCYIAMQDDGAGTVGAGAAFGALRGVWFDLATT